MTFKYEKPPKDIRGWFSKTVDMVRTLTVAIILSLAIYGGFSLVAEIQAMAMVSPIK